jgi:hypothetical protein
VKTAERELARQLRREGASVREIEAALRVSRSSVSLWVRDIRLTDEQQAAVVARNPRCRGKSEVAQRKREAAVERRRGYQDEGRELARRGDPSFAAGCMLFWAEGSRARNTVELTNSDPDMIAFFASFLRHYFAVDSRDMRISCNLFADHVSEQQRIEQFWLDTARLPRSSLRKSMVNVYSKYSAKKRKNRLPYGTCKLVVGNTRVAHMLYGAIQEIAGFDRPEWATM